MSGYNGDCISEQEWDAGYDQEIDEWEEELEQEYDPDDPLSMAILDAD